MGAAKKTHEADAFEARVIAEAVLWTAVQHRGARNRQKAEAASREEAESIGRAMVKDHPARPAMIYAVNAAGRQALAGLIRTHEEGASHD